MIQHWRVLHMIIKDKQSPLIVIWGSFVHNQTQIRTYISKTKENKWLLSKMYESFWKWVRSFGQTFFCHTVALLINQEWLQIIVSWHAGEQPWAGVLMIWCTPFSVFSLKGFVLIGWMNGGTGGDVEYNVCMGRGVDRMPCKCVQKQFDLPSYRRAILNRNTHTKCLPLYSPFSSFPPFPPSSFFFWRCLGSWRCGFVYV